MASVPMFSHMVTIERFWLGAMGNIGQLGYKYWLPKQSILWFCVVLLNLLFCWYYNVTVTTHCHSGFWLLQRANITVVDLYIVTETSQCRQLLILDIIEIVYAQMTLAFTVTCALLNHLLDVSVYSCVLLMQRLIYHDPIDSQYLLVQVEIERK
jgi:hypothetical protein